MKRYWPLAYIITPEGPGMLFTYDAANTFDQAVRQFSVWEKSYNYKIVSRWIDEVDGDVRKQIGKAVDRDRVMELWKQFGTIPVNPETECLEKRWGDYLWNNAFRAGTHLEEVWKWFEESFDVSVAKDLFGREIKPNNTEKGRKNEREGV